MNNFIRQATARIEAARATNDAITIVNTQMDIRDEFFNHDDGSDAMHFFYMDVIQEF